MAAAEGDERLLVRERDFPPVPNLKGNYPHGGGGFIQCRAYSIMSIMSICQKRIPSFIKARRLVRATALISPQSGPHSSGTS